MGVERAGREPEYREERHSLNESTPFGRFAGIDPVHTEKAENRHAAWAIEQGYARLVLDPDGRPMAVAITARGKKYLSEEQRVPIERIFGRKEKTMTEAEYKAEINSLLKQKFKKDYRLVADGSKDLRPHKPGPRSFTLYVLKESAGPGRQEVLNKIHGTLAEIYRQLHNPATRAKLRYD